MKEKKNNNEKKRKTKTKIKDIKGGKKKEKVGKEG